MADEIVTSTLSIIIPAYNEEDSVVSTVEQTVQALPAIAKAGGLERLDIIVVNDGSRDATSARVQAYLQNAGHDPPVQLIEHTVNQGYGAAIKTGFAAARGDVLGFMDADGTCEPLTFGALCRALEEQQADVAIGSRMGQAGSGMPLCRRAGNRLFAGLLSLISTSRVTDSASGMRVLRRSALPLLCPLPDGLHFTPAMSARAVLDPNLKIVEIPMAYGKRVGESKLGLFQDGFRFLAVILEIALTYKPLRFFGAVGALFLLAALLYGVYPVIYYVEHRQVFEWMIYRLVAITVFSVAGLNLVAVGLLANAVVRSFQRLHRSTVRGSLPARPPARRWQRTLLNWLPAAGVFLALLGVGLNHSVLREYITTGHITVHWTYPVTGAFFVLTGLQLFSFGVIHRIFTTLEDKQAFLLPPEKE